MRKDILRTNLSLTGRAYNDIKQQVISGELALGEHFEAGQLAEDLGMSRTPVREALLRLQNEGIIEIIAKKGIRVVPLSPVDLQEIYQIITGLEVEAVGNICALSPTRKLLTPLRKANSLMGKSIRKNLIDEWCLADEQFHRTLFDLCGNERLRAEGHRFRDLAQRAHFVAMRLIAADQKQISVDSHGELIDAIEKGAEKKARTLHLKQRLRGGEMLVSVVKTFGLNLL
jgi:DNA-binding GntR family transcriptional regulator